jgi:hypothetical protein
MDRTVQIVSSMSLLLSRYGKFPHCEIAERKLQEEGLGMESCVRSAGKAGKIGWVVEDMLSSRTCRIDGGM